MGISERELEDWIVENWEDTPWSYGKLVGRQLSLKHGRCDLLAVIDSVAVIELKAKKIREKHVAQVLRYKLDIMNILRSLYHGTNTMFRVRVANEAILDDFVPFVQKGFQVSTNPFVRLAPMQAILVGPSIEENALAAAIAAGVEVYEWETVESGVHFGDIGWQRTWDTEWVASAHRPWMNRLELDCLRLCKHQYMAKQTSFLCRLFATPTTLTDDAIILEPAEANPDGEPTT